MSEIEKYFQDFNSLILTSDKWIRYIILSNELTNKGVDVRLCIRQVKRAHMYYSDYRAKKI